MPNAARATILLVAVLLGIAAIDIATARAQQIVYSFTDPVADQNGPGDVTNLLVILEQRVSTVDPAIDACP
jgi:hypothetical protein